MHAMAVAVGEDLNFDMTGARKIFFDKDAIIAKRRKRLALGAGELRPPYSGSV